MYTDALFSAIGCDSTVNLTLELYPLADSNLIDILCIGDSLVINGNIYNEVNPSGIEVMHDSSFLGCDSTININLSFITGETTGFADAGENTNSCDELETTLSASLPPFTTGVWTSLNNATIDNPDQPITNASNLSLGDNLFVWTLSTTQCTNYDADTVIIFYDPSIPFAEADAFISDLNTPLYGNVILNDEFEGISLFIDQNVMINHEQSTIAGILDFESDGSFSFTPEADSCGFFVFEYEICNAICLEYCSSATVRLEVTPAINAAIDAPNVITPNGDKFNEFFIIPSLHENPSGFPNNKLYIFNQWGVLVYEKQPYQNDWNGVNQKGKPLPQATYYYYFEDGTGGSFSGNVVILK